MPTFVVERYLAGWSPAEIDTVPDALRRARGLLEATGVRHLGSIVLHRDEICWCVFEADDEAEVRMVNAALGLRVDRIAPGRLWVSDPTPAG
jgi:hypothetical protein